jgi:hypothetical protein
MGEKITIKIGETAKVETWRDGEWTILYVEDGGGGVTTVSLGPRQAMDLAQLLRGSGISAAHAPRSAS